MKGDSPQGTVPDWLTTASRLAGLTALLLGWRPDEFWRATPAELATILTVMGGEVGAPPERALVAQLKEQFPDG